MVPLQYRQIFAQNYYCFHLQMRDERKKNIHSTWKSCSFSCKKVIWAIRVPIKIHLFVSDYCVLVLQVGHFTLSKAPLWGICMHKLAPPWGICHNFDIKRQMPRAFGIDRAISLKIILRCCSPPDCWIIISLLLYLITWLDFVLLFYYLFNAMKIKRLNNTNY